METETGPVTAWAYVGLPDYLDGSCLPTRRYLNIIINGARAAGLSESYISKLSKQSLLPEVIYPEFKAPEGNFPNYTKKSLSENPKLTALAGAVFDMSEARSKLRIIERLFGGKDMTLFHLKRHDSSTGNETIDDIIKGNISDQAKKIPKYLSP
ncbi:gamma-glutamylcyclotransferase [Algoriphagus boritolerans]|uniref:gamma-glutamylcyclotransferase n=1 Tax=Algoriphagus boritolerans TaxID=308111 RepID=UPI000ABB5A6F